MEFVRLDSPTLWGVSIAQIVAACMILVTGGILIYRRRRVRLSEAGQDAPTASGIPGADSE